MYITINYTVLGKLLLWSHLFYINSHVFPKRRIENINVQFYLLKCRISQNRLPLHETRNLNKAIKQKVQQFKLVIIPMV